MKRPSVITYLFGNLVSVLALAGAAIYFIYQWWTNHGSATAAVVALLVASYATSNSERLQKYYQWKREWDAMEGRAPGAGFARLYAHPAFRLLIGGPIWCAFAYFAIQPAKDPAMQVAAGLFWFATLIMIVGWIAILLRRRKSRRPKFRDVPVTLCVSVPRQSPALAQAFAALPAYCHPLFADRARTQTTH